MSWPGRVIAGTVQRVAEPKSAEHRRLGQVLREERLSHGLTLEDLGHRASLNPRYLGAVERGEINVALANLLRIVTTLDATLADVARRADL
jgi:transcriptional regulator with XRE-family HTH domain